MKKLLKCVGLTMAALLVVLILTYAVNCACLVRYDPEIFEGLEVGQSAAAVLGQLQERYAPLTSDGAMYEYPLISGQYIQIYVWGEELIVQKISTSDDAHDFATIWYPVLSLFVK